MTATTHLRRRDETARESWGRPFLPTRRHPMRITHPSKLMAFSRWIRQRSVAIAMLLTIGAATVHAVDLSTLPTNTWIPDHPAYVGAPDGGRLVPMGWNNKGVYDPSSQRVIVA